MKIEKSKYFTLPDDDGLLSMVAFRFNGAFLSEDTKKLLMTIFELFGKSDGDTINISDQVIKSLNIYEADLELSASRMFKVTLEIQERRCVVLAPLFSKVSCVSAKNGYSMEVMISPRFRQIIDHIKFQNDARTINFLKDLSNQQVPEKYEETAKIS